MLTLFVASVLHGVMKMNVQDRREKLVNIRDPNVLTVGIWTVHFAVDNEGYFSHENITNLIHKLDIDVIGLLETDTLRPIGGNRNSMRFVADKLNMHTIYGPRPREHTWGCSMLSKYPIVRHQHYLLPSPMGELACAIHATIKVPSGLEVDVLVSHNGQEEDMLDRKLQTETLADIANKSTNPFIFAGYLVTKAGKGFAIYDTITEKGRLKDIYPRDTKRWCQYIMYRDIFPLGYARISPGKITDTELQSAKFWIGENVEEIHLNEGNMYPEDLVENEWNGHRYHVYSKPIYGDELFK